MSVVEAEIDIDAPVAGGVRPRDGPERDAGVGDDRPRGRRHERRPDPRGLPDGPEALPARRELLGALGARRGRRAALRALRGQGPDALEGDHREPPDRARRRDALSTTATSSRRRSGRSAPRPSSVVAGGVPEREADASLQNLKKLAESRVAPSASRADAAHAAGAADGRDASRLVVERRAASTAHAVAPRSSRTASAAARASARDADHARARPAGSRRARAAHVVRRRRRRARSTAPARARRRARAAATSPPRPITTTSEPAGRRRRRRRRSHLRQRLDECNVTDDSDLASSCVSNRYSFTSWPISWKRRRERSPQRLKELRPLVDEYQRLEAAQRALEGVGDAGAAPRPPPRPRARGGRGRRAAPAGAAARGARAPAPSRRWQLVTEQPRHHHPRDGPEDGHPAELPLPRAARPRAGRQGPQGGPGLVPQGRASLDQAELLDGVALLLELVDRDVDLAPARSRRPRGPPRPCSPRPSSGTGSEQISPSSMPYWPSTATAIERRPSAPCTQSLDVVDRRVGGATPPTTRRAPR